MGKFETFIIKTDGKLYHRRIIPKRRSKEPINDRLCVPASCVSLILKHCHEEGHFAFKKTVCEARGYVQKKKIGTLKSLEPRGRFELIGMDVFGGRLCYQICNGNPIKE